MTDTRTDSPFPFVQPVPAPDEAADLTDRLRAIGTEFDEGGTMDLGPVLAMVGALVADAIRASVDQHQDTRHTPHMA